MCPIKVEANRLCSATTKETTHVRQFKSIA
jgi:hypothetical protein